MFKVQLQCCKINDLCCVLAIKRRPELQLMKKTRSQTVVWPTIYPARAQSSYKPTVSYRARYQIESGCTAKNCSWRACWVCVVASLYVFVWSFSFYNANFRKHQDKWYNLDYNYYICNALHATCFYYMTHTMRLSAIKWRRIFRKMVGYCASVWNVGINKNLPDLKKISQRTSIASHKMRFLVLAVIAIISTLRYPLRFLVYSRNKIIKK